MDKMKIYTDQISPLLHQIVEICEKNKIAMLANFCLPSESSPALAALTSLPDETGKIPNPHRRAFDALGFELSKKTIN
ncbi:hypothetical protein [Nitrosomonas oligotropha]|uniref:hypothetical protein n=1 Tax=Nitrosomonas oligotropha TaxID=42354 RepID=UPI00136969F3|nr:hypothetical protein [Nitrosomonas oligotropha]MXS82247.1 hypothetical protein [Nitrosomonas oligotropha]